MMALHEIPLWKVPAIATFMRSAMGRSVAGIRLFDGMAEVLRACSGKWTNCSPRPVLLNFESPVGEIHTCAGAESR